MVSPKTNQSELFASQESSPEKQEGLFAQIVFDRPLDQLYTYLVPKELENQVGIGKRVTVPFGKGDRSTVGFCVALTEESPTRKVKEITRVLDPESLLSENLLRLTRWMADYYLCGWGQVLNAVLPAGAKSNAGMKAVNVIEAVPEEELVNEIPKLTAKQSVALQYLRQAKGPLEVRRLAREANCGPGVLQALVRKGVVRKQKSRVDAFLAARTAEFENPTPPFDKPFELNLEQQLVWNSLREVVQEGGFNPFLLYGVTGSGKTEIYLRAIEEILKQGKQALVLVPEISLTPQTIRRFQGRCGEVAVLHSHLRNAERGSQWRSIYQGKVQVIVGARSAIFAPTQNLGLIVIDEEHESSFKQESTPRYHARDVAVMRARLENIPIILGSATPSLESWQNARRGQYQLLTLPHRVQGLPLPAVSLIDLRYDKPRKGYHQAISQGLEQAMHRALADGGQIILLLNRRGYSTHIHCPGCGFVETCKFCDLALTYHQQREISLCHYCGFEQPPTELCPQCSKIHLRYHGIGTQKLEAELIDKFSGYVVRRMDSDTMRKPGSHERILNGFRNGEIHILLGTQMIAKGLDFPNVTLVGVINADISLHQPDFRAAERTFQLVSQVAGRAGRGPRGGQVLVQTYCPEHPAIQLAAAHDYTTFVGGELAQRKDHLYPPFQRLVRLIIRSREAEPAGQFAEVIARTLQAASKHIKPANDVPMDIRVLGPAEAPVFRLKGYHRFHLQLQSASPGLLHQILRLTLPTLRVPNKVEYTIDVDPLNMM